MASISDASSFEIGVQGGSALAAGSELVAPDQAKRIADIARALNTLQPHTERELVLPDFERLTPKQGADLIAYADALNGEPIRTTWSQVVFTVADPAELARHWNGRSDGYLVTRFYPLLGCGAFDIQLDIEFARTVHMLPPPAHLAERSPNSDVVFLPGEDNTMTIPVVQGTEVDSL